MRRAAMRGATVHAAVVRGTECGPAVRAVGGLQVLGRVPGVRPAVGGPGQLGCQPGGLDCQQASCQQVSRRQVSRQRAGCRRAGRSRPPVGRGRRGAGRSSRAVRGVVGGHQEQRALVGQLLVAPPSGLVGPPGRARVHRPRGRRPPPLPGRGHRSSPVGGGGGWRTCGVVVGPRFSQPMFGNGVSVHFRLMITRSCERVAGAGVILPQVRAGRRSEGSRRSGGTG